MKRVLLASAALFTLSACQNMDALAPWIEQGNQVAKAAGYDTDSRLAGAIKETLSISSDRPPANSPAAAPSTCRSPPRWNRWPAISSVSAWGATWTRSATP